MRGAPSPPPSYPRASGTLTLYWYGPRPTDRRTSRAPRSSMIFRRNSPMERSGAPARPSRRSPVWTPMRAAGLPGRTRRTSRASPFSATPRPRRLQARSSAWAAHLAVGDQVAHHAPRAVDGNGKPDALRLAVDRRVDADELAADVEERATGVARVDRGVGLDEVGVGAFLAAERAVEGAHHPRRHRVREAKRIADGDHRLPDHDAGRGAERHGRECPAGLDAENGDVLSGVGPHQLRIEFALVGERHVNAARAQDDVLVGEDGA